MQHVIRETENGEKTLAKVQAVRSRCSEVTPERTSHLFPNQCLICKREKYRTQLWSPKRFKEKLTLCETPTVGKFLTAAEERRDESLLVQIQGKDLKAFKVQYHFTCYRDYSILDTRTGTKIKPRTNAYENRYKYFCKTGMKGKLFENPEVCRLSQLTELFEDIVKEKEGVAIPAYTNQSLKAKLQKSHPSPRFEKAF